jgi:hypothetical protein
MSLTGHLHIGALAAWCAANLPGTRAVATDVATRLAETTAGRPPVRPHHIATRDHWAAIGGALGQRLAFATQHAPPYYALLGAHSAGLADWSTIQRCAARFPTHIGLDPARAARANQLRPLPGGQWLDLDHPGADLAGRSSGGTRPALLLDLVERLVAFLTDHAPPGQLADTRGAEAVLARACIALTACESAYRGGQLAPADAARWADPATTATDLLDAVPDHQVAELVELTTRAHTAGLLPRLADPTAGPARTGIAGPVLVEHWADGDLLLPPALDDHPATDGGWTLIDVKTVTSARSTTTVGRWLWQLLAYAWLDAADRYRIRAVGLYFARHGALLTWPLPHLTAALLGQLGADTAATARADFRAAAARAWAADSGQPTTASLGK